MVRARHRAAAGRSSSPDFSVVLYQHPVHGLAANKAACIVGTRNERSRDREASLRFAPANRSDRGPLRRKLGDTEIVAAVIEHLIPDDVVNQARRLQGLTDRYRPVATDPGAFEPDDASLATKHSG